MLQTYAQKSNLQDKCEYCIGDILEIWKYNHIDTASQTSCQEKYIDNLSKKSDLKLYELHLCS